MIRYFLLYGLMMVFMECFAQGSTSVTNLGIVSSESIDQTAQIETAVASGRSLYFPAGKYIISRMLVLQNGQTISGDKGKTILIWKGLSIPKVITAFFSAQGIHDFSLKDLSFTGTADNALFALRTNHSSHIILEGLNCTSCGLIFCGGLYTSAYYACSAEDNTYIKILHCKARGNDNPTSTAILLSYSSNWLISDVHVTGFNQGIQWWGGDSDPGKDGEPENPRKCTDGLIEHCSSRNIDGGGIWGSMGNRIKVSYCTVTDCRDVGIDFEGCLNSVASFNKASHCKNGALAIFHYCDNMLFELNTVIGSATEYLASINNASQTQKNKQVVFKDNTFSSSQGISQVIQKGPATDIRFIGNHLLNGIIDFSFNNNKDILIRSNTFLFERPLTGDFVIQAGMCHNQGLTVIESNTLKSSVGQLASVYPIHIIQDDFNSEPVNRVTNNSFAGFKNNIKITWAGGNPGIRSRTYIKSFKPVNVKRVETGKSRSTLFMNSVIPAD